MVVVFFYLSSHLLPSSPLTSVAFPHSSSSPKPIPFQIRCRHVSPILDILGLHLTFWLQSLRHLRLLCPLLLTRHDSRYVLRAPLIVCLGFPSVVHLHACRTYFPLHLGITFLSLLVRSLLIPRILNPTSSSFPTSSSSQPSRVLSVPQISHPFTLLPHAAHSPTSSS